MSSTVAPRFEPPSLQSTSSAENRRRAIIGGCIGVTLAAALIGAALVYRFHRSTRPVGIVEWFQQRRNLLG